MIGIVWTYRLFYDDDDCDEEEESQQETETGPRTGQSNGGDTTQDARRRAAALRRAKNVPPNESAALLSKNQENCPFSVQQTTWTSTHSYGTQSPYQPRRKWMHWKPNWRLSLNRRTMRWCPSRRTKPLRRIHQYPARWTHHQYRQPRK